MENNLKDEELDTSKEIVITDIHFKQKKKDGSSLWNPIECRNYLYHLGLKPNKKRCVKSNGYYKYSITDESGKNILKDDNEITIYYV